MNPRTKQLLCVLGGLFALSWAKHIYDSASWRAEHPIAWGVAFFVCCSVVGILLVALFASFEEKGK